MKATSNLIYIQIWAAHWSEAGSPYSICSWRPKGPSFCGDV